MLRRIRGPQGAQPDPCDFVLRARAAQKMRLERKIPYRRAAKETAIRVGRSDISPGMSDQSNAAQ